MRQLPFAFLVLALAGCASHAANTAPDPQVIELLSVPSAADVAMTCGGETTHRTTPLRVDVPPEDESCTIELTKEGYLPARQHFDRGFVLRHGEPLRVDEHHELDESRVTSPFDVAMFPLQKLADRIQNWFVRKIVADYRVTIELLPQR